jgi:putative transposase
MATQILTRKQRGETIVKVSQEIERVSEFTFRVHSQKGRGEYTVTNEHGLCSCDCPDFKFRGVKCKHIFAVEFALSEQLPRSKVSIGLWD